MHRTISRHVLNISREGVSTTPLRSLLQCFVTLKVKKFFLMFRWNRLCFTSHPVHLSTTQVSNPSSSIWAPLEVLEGKQHCQDKICLMYFMCQIKIPGKGLCSNSVFTEVSAGFPGKAYPF